jgi:DNA-binding NtrC family response regulator
MEDLRHRIGQLQEVDSPVLILGESGTGKDLVARAIHSGSLRTKERLQVVDCTAVPKDLMESELFGHKKGSFTGALQDKQGLLEAADGGTLFLDEIGDMPLELQSRLLRALESKEFRRVGETATRKVDVRILSATNRDLETMIQKGEFREDLYYRLKVVTLRVPALRERREDILPLAEHFLRLNLEERSREYTGFTPAAVPFLLSHPWPGNVRELKNTIEGACAFLRPGNPVEAEDLQLVAHRDRMKIVPPSPAGEEPGLKEYKEDAEKLVLQEALEECDWVVSRAARRLGISRQHLHNRIRHHGLQRPSPRRGRERA